MFRYLIKKSVRISLTFNYAKWLSLVWHLRNASQKENDWWFVLIIALMLFLVMFRSIWIHDFTFIPNHSHRSSTKVSLSNECLLGWDSKGLGSKLQIQRSELPHLDFKVQTLTIPYNTNAQRLCSTPKTCYKSEIEYSEK